MAVCQNLVPLVNIKIAGKWMFIPLKIVLIGIDPYSYHVCPRYFSNAAATTASFSIGDMLQVEYNKGPAGFKIVRPRFNMALCTSAEMYWNVTKEETWWNWLLTVSISSPFFDILWYSLPDRKHSAFAACSVDATMPIHSGCAANVHRLRSSWPFRNSVNVNSCKFGIESKVATCRVCHPAEPEQGTSQRTRSKRIFRAPRTRPSEWSCSVGNWANSGENGNMQSDPTSAQDGKPQHEFSSYYVSQGSWIHEVAECLDCTVFC